MPLLAVLAGEINGGIFDLDLSFVLEVLAFVAMIMVLARCVYPRVSAAAYARVDAIKAQQDAAERARQEAERRLSDVEAGLQEARGRATSMVDEAARSGERARAELRASTEAEAAHEVEGARADIEEERRKLIDSVRGEVPALVASAAEKVVGEPLDRSRFARLIDEAVRTDATWAGGPE
jgi:F-type H+-transporting ATPase subunit b